MCAFRKFLLLGLLIITGTAYGQTNKKADRSAVIKRITEAKTYTFIPEAATPLNSAEISKVLSAMPGSMGGGYINIRGGGYLVRVTPDSVVAELPYFGRAYRAPIKPDDNGIRFTSTKFSYKENINKKGIREISIKPGDNPNGYWLTFSISPEGNTSLMVSSNDKQSISYAGIIEEKQ